MKVITNGHWTSETQKPRPGVTRQKESTDNTAVIIKPGVEVDEHGFPTWEAIRAAQEQVNK